MQKLIFDLLTIDWRPFLAAWGAVVSTGLALMKVRENRRQVRVSCLPSIDPLSGEEYITIQAVNTGVRPVVIQDAGLMMNDGSRLNHMGIRLRKEVKGVKHVESELPKKLTQDETFQVEIGDTAIQTALVGKRDLYYTFAFGEDTLGKIYKVRHLPRRMKDRGLTRDRQIRSDNQANSNAKIVAEMCFPFNA